MSFYNPDPRDGNDPLEPLVKLWERVKGVANDFIRDRNRQVSFAEMQSKFELVANHPEQTVTGFFARYGQNILANIKDEHETGDTVSFLSILRRQREIVPPVMKEAHKIFEAKGNQHTLASGLSTLVCALKPCEEVAIPAARAYLDLGYKIIRGHPAHPDAADRYFKGVATILGHYKPHQNVHLLMTRELPDLCMLAGGFNAEDQFEEHLGKAYRAMDPIMRNAAERSYRDGTKFGEPH